MFEIVLFEPEIPPNTGNIIRLCANSGMTLNLVEPMGFTLEDKQLIRAGLDYHEFASINVHPDWASCLSKFDGRRLLAFTTKGKVRYDKVAYRPGDVFVFGPESRGLPAPILNSFPEDRRLRIPMQPGSRSLNLSNSAAVVVFEAWRQHCFEGSI
ncbi:MAG TPA: tRNA (cytidine(34)-2'-O)-methyltransferase [Burkholderiales bacterium]|nr:tRNA (cytidine(34)-2'-O)-methyltransferase [Burkholderiales bacterium]